MKIFTVILSALFLSLNLMPCGDLPQEKDCDAVSLEENCPTGETEHSGELCSPFCQQCHCCHVHSLDLRLAEVMLYNPEISTEVFLHFQKKEEDVVLSHFQPPRFDSVIG